MDDLRPARFRRFVIPIVLLFAASAAMRWRWRDDRGIVSNIDAPYHVLLTVEAMDRTPASVHHFLPIVTLGRSLDRDVAFGSSVRGPSGIYYYTSFPPLGFIAPWAFFHLTHLSPTIRHLMVFNLAIHLVATLLLALLVSEAVAKLDVDRTMHAWLVMLASVSYLFTFEALYSHGIVYWHHSLFQVVWLVQLVAVARIFRAVDDGEPIRRHDAALLLTSGLLGPAIEWTGYVATASVAGLCWWRSRLSAQSVLRHLAIGLLASAAIAGIGFIVHFASVIGFQALLDGLRARAGARSTAHGSFSKLGAGYVESFGALLGFAAVVLSAYLLVGRRRPSALWVTLLVMAAVIPLSENLVLAEHATIYHFDRLKALVALVAMSAVLIALLPPALQQRAVFCWVAVLGWNLTHLERSRTILVDPPIATNDVLLKRVSAVARPCAVYATNAVPRGWVELSLGGNTYESVPNVDSLRRIVASRGACQGLYFSLGRYPGQAMYLWQRATIYDAATGRIDTLLWSPPPAHHPQHGWNAVLLTSGSAP